MIKLEIFVPGSHADAIMEALHKAGAGRTGKYDHCFSVSEVRGCWRPLEGSNPYQGEAGRIEWADEMKIETVCDEAEVVQAVALIRKAHPYEEPVIHVIPLSFVLDGVRL